MIEDPKPTPEAEEIEAAEASAEVPAGGPDPVAALAADNERLAGEAAEAKDRALRVLAEMENLRRRTERELADAKAYAVTSFARDLLGVADNLARALDALPPEVRSGADAGLAALIDGIDLTRRELENALAKHGVKRIEAEGARFDPNLHQAMFEVPNPDVPNGTVVQVVQSGYVIGERVLRPAMVGVARGGPKAAPAAGATVDRTI